MVVSSILTMPANKAHHFVPQFYLRRFSGDGRSVSTLLLKERRIIPCASIRHQCQKPNFYGKGTAEEGFQLLEGDTAAIFRDIERTLTIPAKMTEMHQMLALYLAAQRARTIQAVNEQNEFTDECTRRYLREHLPQESEARMYLDQVQIELKDPVSENLRTILPMYPLLLDLKSVLIRNQSKIGFITSDHPVVFYNQLCECRRLGSFTGFQSAGLQIFLPISPSLCLMFFDSEVYGLGRKNPRIVDADEASTIMQLNNLQYLSAADNVYYSPLSSNDKLIVEAFSRIAHMRRRTFATWVEETEELGGGRYRKNHRFFREDVKCRLDLGFIKIKQGMRLKTIGTVPYIEARNPEICQLHKLFMEKLRLGQCSPGDFFEFYLRNRRAGHL